MFKDQMKYLLFGMYGTACEPSSATPWNAWILGEDIYGGYVKPGRYGQNLIYQ